MHIDFFRGKPFNTVGKSKRAVVTGQGAEGGAQTREGLLLMLRLPHGAQVFLQPVQLAVQRFPNLPKRPDNNIYDTLYIYYRRCGFFPG